MKTTTLPACCGVALIIFVYSCSGYYVGTSGRGSLLPVRIMRVQPIYSSNWPSVRYGQQAFYQVMPRVPVRRTLLVRQRPAFQLPAASKTFSQLSVRPRRPQRPQTMLPKAPRRMISNHQFRNGFRSVKRKGLIKRPIVRGGLIRKKKIPSFVRRPRIGQFKPQIANRKRVRPQIRLPDDYTVVLGGGRGGTKRIVERDGSDITIHSVDGKLNFDG